jgi:hypothetical protein
MQPNLPAIRLRIIVLATVAAALVLPFASAHASVSSDAVAALNQVRAQVGVDPIANDETLAGDCQLHATWMRRNRSVSHYAAPGTPGWTVNGADAGQRSVLHDAFVFSPQTTPQRIHWLVGAPLHLYQLLHPGLLRSGYAYDDTYACMWTLDPRERPAIDVHDRTKGRDAVFTWPPNRATGVPHQESTAGETPNPNEALGLPRAQVTGPYLLVYAAGFGGISQTCNAIRISTAKLVGPDGSAVAVRSWDDARTIDQYDMTGCPVPAGGGYLVAERPLRPGTRYTATVGVVGADAPAATTPTTHSWTFTTAGAGSGGEGGSGTGGTDPAARPTLRLRSASASRSGRRYSWRLVATAQGSSRLTCSASVQRVRVPCRVSRGQIVLAGSRTGQPSTVAFSIVVRDAARREGRLRTSRRLR